MTTDERRLRWDGPVALRGVEVGVADTGALHLDETLAGLEILGLRDGDLLDLERRTGRADDGGLHGLGDVVGRHGGAERSRWLELKSRIARWYLSREGTAVDGELLPREDDSLEFGDIWSCRCPLD